MTKPRDTRIWTARLALAGVALLIWAAPGLCEQVLSKVSWSQLEREGKLQQARVLPADGQTRFESVRLENEGAEPRIATVFTLEKPGVTASRYAVRGQVRYEGMAGTGYLELWNYFPGGGRYFSRTLGSVGPMASLTGSSAWRPFLLPFDTNGQGVPHRLVVNVVFAGRGVVFLGPVELVQYSGSENPLTPAGAWWSDRQAGMLGGLAGSLLGVLGALIGILAATGRARRLVMGLLKLLIAVCAAGLLLGLAALGLGQPYGVYYPLILVGVIGVAVPAGLLRSFKKRYDELELRRMSALDMTGA